MAPIDRGRRRIRDALPAREVFGELPVLYQRIFEYMSYFYGFQQNAFPQKMLFHEMISTKCRKNKMGKSKKA